MRNYKVVLKYANDQCTMYSCRSQWNQINNIKVYGYNCIPFSYISKKDQTIDAVKEYLFNIRCNFAVIYEGNNCVWVATDSIGSVPLYYSKNRGIYYFSDDANYLAKQLGISADPNRIEEFRACSYTTGSNTLYQSINQVLPGEVLYLDLDSEELMRVKYFEYTYRPQTIEEEDLVDEYDEVLISVFKRLVERLNGRQALIPLSGGLDSRTVAAMLKRVGYDNVLCFSYGRKGNFESERSKIVSNTLGYRWIYEEYTGKTWEDFYSSSDYTDFVKYSGRGSGIGCIQAVPAMISIKNNKCASENAIVVPGHALDFLCGSHLKKIDSQMKKEQLVEHIKGKHYSLCKYDTTIPFEQSWGEDYPERMSADEYVNLYMQWEYCNRQSKFIANDVRAYEYVGYDYDLPCWDIDLIRFWSGIPFDFLFGRKLQKLHMMKVINPLCGITRNEFEGTSKTAIKNIIPQFIMNIRKKHRIWNSQYDYCDAFYDYMSAKEFHDCLKKYGLGFTVDTFVVEKTLELHGIQ